ncbi:hypothetical protein F9817_22755 [Vibrio sp. CAIM 722]|uniref:Prepilin type IV endopeptidase peptidase domain-containing protein n=1 Tax=Vibrio eleionomae TaxID=2653505 RepID=A0A7X4RX17_9VIBR|nr:hypothetical protein [Vibrio eleionomae]MZI96010.1 hypothetical protein [Vibrio eleionomae]
MMLYLALLKKSLQIFRQLIPILVQQINIKLSFSYSQGLLIILLALVLIRVICSDILRREIGTYDLIFILILVVVADWLNINQLVYLSALKVFSCGIIVWLLGICGAGDIKLLTILSLGVSQQWLLLCVVIMLFLGGVTAGGLLLYSKCSGRKEIVNRGVPYAIPIVLSFGFGIILTFLSK